MVKIHVINKRKIVFGFQMVGEYCQNKACCLSCQLAHLVHLLILFDLGLGPRLQFSRSEYRIEHHSHVVNSGGQYEHLAPALPRLRAQVRPKLDPSKCEGITTFGERGKDTFTLFLMIRLMATGHSKPAIVPIPFEMPISMLAYLGAMSK